MRTKSIPLAIDPKLDCYAVLGVDANADHAAIRAAFAAGFQHYHPNHFSGTRSEARRKLADLSAAYELLSDPVRRRRYDLHRRIHAAAETIDARRSESDHEGAASAADDVASLPRPDRYRVPSYVLMGIVLLAAGYAAVNAERLLAALAPPAASAKLPVPPAGVNGRRAPLPAQAAPVAAVQTAPTRQSEARPGRSAPARLPAAPVTGECSDVLTALGLCPPGTPTRE